MEPKDTHLIREITAYCGDIKEAITELDINYSSLISSSSRKAVLSFFVMQIGECANKLSPEFTKTHSDVNWRDIANMRHHIVHNYGAVDVEILWDAVQNDVPTLCDYCHKLLNPKSDAYPGSAKH